MPTAAAIRVGLLDDAAKRRHDSLPLYAGVAELADAEDLKTNLCT